MPIFSMGVMINSMYRLSLEFMIIDVRDVLNSPLKKLSSGASVSFTQDG